MRTFTCTGNGRPCDAWFACREGVTHWWEFVDSESDCADGLSRFKFADSFCISKGIPVREVKADPACWTHGIDVLWERISVVRRSSE